MSHPRRDDQYLADIQEAMQRALEYTQGLTFAAFMDQRMTQDAVLRNLQVIGEAAKKLSGELCARHPEAPWRDMAGLRDRIVHDYFGIDYEVVWDVIESDLPVLLPIIEAIAQEESAAKHG